uniref:Uncharacterized protein n=1 Tax=viral metagenome TaxID=1070528 RepID=A0A6C0EFL7_9ZZZZ
MMRKLKNYIKYLIILNYDNFRISILILLISILILYIILLE